MPIVKAKLSRSLVEMIVFPIIKALFYPDGTEIHKLVGTGFFIDKERRFLTARHVFEGRDSAFELEDAMGYAVYCVHTVNTGRQPVARHIDVSSIVLRDDTDVASGIVEMNQFGKPNDAISELELRETAYFNHFTEGPVPVGSRIVGLGYPRAQVTCTPGEVQIHSQSDAYEGTILEYFPERVDSSLLKWPCYRTDMPILPAASGGPVFANGVVFGINCTSIDGADISHVTSLAPLAKR